VHIQQGRPMQNGHAEGFNGKPRDECLNTSWFENLWDARRKIATRQKAFNRERPHSSQGIGHWRSSRDLLRSARLRSPRSAERSL
jgi:transposase InsO family protein